MPSSRGVICAATESGDTRSLISTIATTNSATTPRASQREQFLEVHQKASYTKSGAVATNNPCIGDRLKIAPAQTEMLHRDDEHSEALALDR